MTFYLRIYNVHRPEDRYVEYCDVSITRPDGSTVAHIPIACYQLANLLGLADGVAHEFHDGDLFALTLTLG